MNSLRCDGRSPIIRQIAGAKALEDQAMGRNLLRISMCMFFVLAVGSARSEDAPDALTTFADATLVIGQKNFTSSKCDNGKANPAKGTLCGPEGPVAWGKKVFYITDTGNDRVLGFKNVPTKNGASAKFVLGQKNLTKSKMESAVSLSTTQPRSSSRAISCWSTTTAITACSSGTSCRPREMQRPMWWLDNRTSLRVIPRRVNRDWIVQSLDCLWQVANSSFQTGITIGS